MSISALVVVSPETYPYIPTWGRQIEKVIKKNYKYVLFSVVATGFLLSTYEIWKILVSLAKKNFFFIADFHVLGLFIPKNVLFSVVATGFFFIISIYALCVFFYFPTNWKKGSPR
jgi:hypothetical protein